MTDKKDKPSIPAFNMNSMNAGMFGLAIPMPFPVFAPQVMPIRMIPPLWPPNNAFMQQYMETISAQMAQAMGQSTVTGKEQSDNLKTANSNRDGTSMGSSSTSCSSSGLDNANNHIDTNQLQGDPGKRQGNNLPQFPHTPVLFPFGGFFPFGSYLPYINQNVAVNGFTSNQGAESETCTVEETFTEDLKNSSPLESMEVSREPLQLNHGDKREEQLSVKSIVKPSEENTE